MSALSPEQITGADNSHIVWLSERIGLQAQVCQAWQKMQQAALADGLELAIASGFRDLLRQLTIWNNKFLGVSKVNALDNSLIDLTQLTDVEKIRAILLFSALPGTSRHHWGTDLDIYAPNCLPDGQQLKLECWEYQQGGPFYPLSKWLTKYAKDFGFYCPYDQYRGGVASEPWHISYYPLAQHYLNQLTPELIINTLSATDIQGFETIKAHIDTIFSQYISNIGEFTHG